MVSVLTRWEDPVVWFCPKFSWNNRSLLQFLGRLYFSSSFFFSCLRDQSLLIMSASCWLIFGWILACEPALRESWAGGWRRTLTYILYGEHDEKKWSKIVFINDLYSNKTMYLQETPVKYIYNLFEPENKLRTTSYLLRVQTKNIFKRNRNCNYK